MSQFKVPTLENFQKRLSDLQKKSNIRSSNIQFRLNKPDELNKTDSAILRVLPYPFTETGDPFIEVYFHYGIGKYGTVSCPEKNFGEPCAICNQYREIYKMTEKIARENNIDHRNRDKMLENTQIKIMWSIAKDIKPKKRVYVPVIVRGKESEGVKFFAMSDNFFNTVLQAITKKISRNPAKNPVDPYNGVDIEFTITNDGKTYGTTTFDILSDDEPTPALPGATKEQIDELIGKVPDLWKTLLTKKSSEEVERIASELKDEDGLINPSTMSNTPEPKETESSVTISAPTSSAASSVSDGLDAIDTLGDDDDEDI